MRLIVTHEQPDFDALASLALARLLFPDAVATVQGALSPELESFLRLYRDVLELRDARTIEPAEVTELVVVDTSDARRIAPFSELAGRVPVTLYDHHPLAADSIAAAHGVREEVGATATLLTRALRARDIPIPPAVASLALLGIHEDTGNLSYDMTTPDDYVAAADLLAAGASLQLVRRYTRDLLTPELLAFRGTMLEHASPITVAGRRVSLTIFRYPRYVPGVSGLTNDLLDADRVDAAVMAVAMGGKTLVFARADDRFDVAAALAESLGGAGHPGAAFARTDLDPDQAAGRVIEALAHHATRVIRAADLMSAPVTTIPADATIANAHAALERYGYNGMPVLDASGGVVGVVSRRDLERAIRHGLAPRSVSGFMSRDVVSASTTVSLEDLEDLIVKHDIGRIPVMDERGLVGIVTRSDLIGARHRNHQPIEPGRRVLERLPSRARAALELASEACADVEGAALYLVGGTVRDALLGIGPRDLDLTVVGMSAGAMGERLRSALGGTLACHDDFGTCTLSLPSGLVLDLASAREERYELPGALPSVRPSTLRKDLERRDFSVNALALRVHPRPPELIDPFGGTEDLAAKRLRVLHPLSFVEDPTRILRGARLAGRLGLRFDANTADAARAAVPYVAESTVSNARLRSELESILAEPRVAPALERLVELGAVEALFGLNVDLAQVEALDVLRRAGAVPDDAYLLALLLATPMAHAAAHVEAFGWPHRLVNVRAALARCFEGAFDVLDRDLESLDPAAAAVVTASGGELAARLRDLQQAPVRRRLRGSDVLGLGLAPGPAVGHVLDEVAQARSEHRVHTFEDELELASRLIRETEP